jgi:hypothetical protein
MKKLILSVTAGLVLCTAGFIGYKIYNDHQMSKLNPLMAENLEALSDPESSVGGPNGGFNSTGRGTPLAGTEYELTTKDRHNNVSVSLFPSYNAALAQAQASFVSSYTIKQFMWYQYDCDQSTNQHCVVCFRYQVNNGNG